MKMQEVASKIEKAVKSAEGWYIASAILWYLSYGGIPPGPLPGAYTN